MLNIFKSLKGFESANALNGCAESPKEQLWQNPAAAALCQQHRNLEGLALINKGTKAGPGGRSSVRLPLC